MTKPLLVSYMKYLADTSDKKAIFVTSRVHSGEVQSSFAVEGLIDFLLSDNEQAIDLRQKYIIYIVPMLNIDGVIYGNSRTNLTGFDLNRVWAKPSLILQPEIYAVKKFAEVVSRDR